MLKKILSPLNLLKFAGLLVFLAIIMGTDLAAVREKLSIIVSGSLGLVLALVASQTLIKFTRWHVLVRMINGTAPPLLKSFLIYYNGFFWGAATPGKLGEFVKVFYLSNNGVPATSGILAIILERVFDVLCALLFAAVLVPVCFNVSLAVYAPAVIAIAAIIIFMYFLMKEAVRNFIFNTISISAVRRGGFNVKPDEMRALLKEFLSVKIFLFGLLTVFYWGFTAYMFFIVLNRCGISLDFIFVLVSHSAVLLGVMLPISIFGVGVREGLLQWMLTATGRTEEEALVYSFLILSLMLLQAGIGAVTFLFFKDKPKKREAVSQPAEETETADSDPWTRVDRMREEAGALFEKHREDVCVVIPTRNEAETVQRIIDGVKPYAGEILVIDGHSTDGTIDIVKKNNLRYILDEGKGKGCALRQAIQEVDKPILVFIDADGSHNPQDIPLLVAPIIRDEVDHVTGSRSFGGSDELSGTDLDTFLRLLGSEFVTLLINYRFGTRLTDSQDGFRAMKTDMAKTLPLQENLTTIEQEMIIKTLAAGYRMGEAPTHEYSRWAGESKISLKNVWFRYVYTAIKYCLFA